MGVNGLKGLLDRIDTKKGDFDGAFLKSCELKAEKQLCKNEGCKGCPECPAIKLVGYASTFGNVDREEDEVAPTAFNKHKKYIKDLAILRDHKNQCDSVIGRVKDFEIDTRGLKVTCNIARYSSDPTIKHVLEMIEKGIINTFSIGGMFKYRPRKATDKNWVIDEIKLFELSIVAIPANEKATFQMVENEPEKNVTAQEKKDLDHENILKSYRKLRGNWSEKKC